MTACDADGLRLLTGAGRPGRGHGLLLRGVPPALRDRLHAEGLDAMPGVSIEHRSP